MKAVILAGGLGSRLSEETRLKPKPMVEVGDRPILWHIMKIFSHHGIRDFVVCLGYRGYFIKEYFANYQLHNSDVTFDYRDGQLKIHQHTVEPWSITLVDTGLHTMTGGRLKRIRDYVSDGPFLMTYGDGVGDVDIRNLVEFHKSHDSAATVTAVRPPGRFGRLAIDDDARVDSFAEKPVWDGGFINGGFFVLEPEVLDRVEGDESIWEREPMESLARDGQLRAFLHNGFWQPMDTLRDKQQLDQLWKDGRAPWKIWDDVAATEASTVKGMGSMTEPLSQQGGDDALRRSA